jgi:CubicO group peptidase (beta-lactamase class C family)
LPERVAKAAQERIAAGTYQTIVFAVVDGDKSEIVAFGKLPDGKTPDGDTVYEIGSITKTFTATLLAEAVQSGRLQLDEPVAQLLPDFKIPARNGKQITLLEIATQHSGLPRMPSNLAPADPANPYADYGTAQLKAFLAGYELPRDPGASYEYSNLAFGLLGTALSQNAHRPYGVLLQRKILQPLGMTMSGIVFSDAMRARLAPGYDESGKPAKNWDFDALASAGAIRSTATDLLRYLKANMRAGQTPLTKAMKFAQFPRADMDKDTRIGLAWMIDHGNVVWHGGVTGGYRSFLGFTIDGRHGVVVLTNTPSSPDDLGFATLMSDAPLEPTYKAISLPSASLDEYAGSYKLAEGFVLKVFRADDQLFAQATGQDAFPIYPSAPNEFFARVAGISISFTRDAKGAVNGLVLHQNGDRAAPKMSAAELPQQPKEAQLDAATLQSYAGKYQLAPGYVFDITLTGSHLFAQLTGQAALPVFASAKDEFFYTVAEAKLSFERDAKGNIVAVVLHQNGRDMRAPRMAP